MLAWFLYNTAWNWRHDQTPSKTKNISIKWDWTLTTRILATCMSMTFFPTCTSQGIRGGLCMIIVGILSTRAKKNSSRCMYNANMVVNIITATILASAILLSCVAAVTSFYSAGLIVTNASLSILCFVGMIIFIVHSTYYCGRVCCNGDTSPSNAIYVTPPIASYPQSWYAQGPDV